jgi:predicted MPP superfamily phosphohydrolase
MRSLNLIIAADILFFVLGGLTTLLLWLLNRGWWRLRLWRATVLTTPVAGILGAAIWALGARLGLPFLEWAGALITPTAFILEISLLLSLLLSGILNSIVRIIDIAKRWIARNKERFSPSRRRFSGALAAVFPATLLPAGVGGVTGSFAGITVPVRHIPVSKLPAALEGFKIAHLSDMHLGYYVQLDDLREAIDAIIPYRPDLVLVTGDISDDLDILPEALSIINRLTPQYGIFASVGNHEYYRGIARVLEIFQTAPFPLLVNESIRLDIRGMPVVIGGADDPVYLRRDNAEFLRNTIDNAIGSAPAEALRLLMCHRPEGFNHSAEIGLDLVLAGHTHGGQIGISGRSLFEGVLPDKYLWGLYRRGNTTLFTSGGMGHWLPFRLGCPAEAPILVLERG